MKREEIFEFFDKQGHRNVQKADEAYIRVMTSNVLHSHDYRSPLSKVSFEERLEIQAATFLYFKPDFIGLQEVSYEQEPVLLSLVSDLYAMPDTPLGDAINYVRNSPPYAGIREKQNHTPILYNKEKYEVVESRYHLFGGLHSFHIAVYREKADPTKKVIHMNVHFYPDGVGEAHTELVHMRKLYPTTPIFVTGDYNMFEDNPKIAQLFEGLNMVSGMLVAEENDGFMTNCHNINETKLCEWPAIDHIGVTTDLVDVKLHRNLMDELIALSSDHSPVFIDAVRKA